MSLEYILILVYLTLFGVVIFKTPLFHSEKISRKFIFGVFLGKVGLSFLYGYIHHVNGWGDTFKFFQLSKSIAELWPEHSAKFFRLLFDPTIPDPLPEGYQRITGLEEVIYTGLSRSGLILRVNVLLQIFSFGYYSVHCIFFAFFGLTGIFFAYDFFIPYFKEKSLLLKLFLFFTPSIFYWSSGVHKESLIVLGLGCMLFTFQSFINKRSFLWFFAFLLAGTFSYFARDYLFFLFFPALMCYGISGYFHKNPFLVNVIVYGLAFIFFFTGKYIHPDLNFPKVFIDVQSHFLGLKGGSNFHIEPLQPTVWSFLQAVPSALFNTLFKPGFSETQTFLSFTSVIENISLVFLAMYAILSSSIRKLSEQQVRVVVFCFSFAISFYLLLGLTVSNVGALVRYKSTGLIFMITAFIAILDLKQLSPGIRLLVTEPLKLIKSRKSRL